MKAEIVPASIEKTVFALNHVKPEGSAWTLDGPRSCLVCGKSIGPLGKKTGASLTCTADACELVSMSNLSKVLRTAYGPAIHLDILAILTHVWYMGPKITCGRPAILSRCLVLAEALQDLTAWQIAYDSWERQTKPDAWAQGRIQVVPPRYLDEVRAWRAMSDPVRVDPTWRIPEKIAREIRKLREEPAADLRIEAF